MPILIKFPTISYEALAAMPAHAEPESSPHPGQVQQQALAWFTRMQDVKASPRQRAEFAEWLAADPLHRAAYDKVARLWHSPALNVALGHYAAIPLQPAKPRLLQPRRWAGAAGILLLCGWLLGGGWIEKQRADMATATGEQRQVMLADGSALILNTDTAVKLDYTERQRGVKLLSGEAYFEVQPDKSRPFVVATEQGEVRVVGTRFSVKTGEATQVDVESGLVDCVAKQGGSRQFTAGQHTRIDRAGVAAAAAIDTGQAFAWLNGRLIFKDQPLFQVLAELDRYHPGVIVIANAKLGLTRVSGNYKLADTAAVVRALADITGAREITLSPYLTLLR